MEKTATILLWILFSKFNASAHYLPPNTHKSSVSFQHQLSSIFGFLVYFDPSVT